MKSEIQNIINSINDSVYYEHDNGCLLLGDSIEILKKMPDNCVDLIFADPPYSIKKAEWDIFTSREEYISFTERWIEQAYRVLKQTGTLYVCGFSEILAEIQHSALKYFKQCKWLIWFYKNKANICLNA